MNKASIPFYEILHILQQQKQQILHTLETSTITLDSLYQDKSCLPYVIDSQKCYNCGLLLHLFDTTKLFEHRSSSYIYNNEQLDITYHRVSPHITYNNELQKLYKRYVVFSPFSNECNRLATRFMFNDSFTQQMLVAYFIEKYVPYSVQHNIITSYSCGLRGYRIMQHNNNLTYAELLAKYSLSDIVQGVLVQLKQLYKTLAPYYFYYGCLHILNLLYIDIPYNNFIPFTVYLNIEYYTASTAFTINKTRLCNKNILLDYKHYAHNIKIPQHQYINGELYYKVEKVDKYYWQDLMQLGIVQSSSYELWHFLQSWCKYQPEITQYIQNHLNISITSEWIPFNIMLHLT